MVDVRAFIASLKLSWLKRLQKCPAFREFVNNLYPQYGNIEVFGNLYVKKLIEDLPITDSFRIRYYINLQSQ